MKKNKTISILIIFLSLFLISCEEKQTTSSLIVNLNQEITKRDKSILPEDIPLEVTQYTITGTGPFEGDSFTVNIKDNKTTINGLTQGTWDLFAVGKNIDGLLLVSGSKEVTIDKNPTSAVIDLNKLVGNGNINIEFIWDAELTNNPKLELELVSKSNSKLNVKPTTIDYTQGIATFETVARADSYTLNAKLYEGDVLLAGCIEAIRVVMNKTSEGTIHFNINENNDNNNSAIPIVINNQAGVPITCHIEDIPDVVSYNQEIYPTLKEENNLPLTDFTIEWYLDGGLIGTGIDCSLKPKIGFHRLDVIVENGDIGSTSSAHKEFEVKVNAPAYLPKVIASIDNGENGFYVGANMIVRFLPDNKIISYCGETHTLQICRLINNSIEVVKTYNNSYEMPLANVNDIQVDSIRNRVFISEQSTNTISIYDYSYNSLTKYFSDNTYHKYAKNFGQIFIRPKDFLVFDHLGDSYREYKIDPKLDSKFYAINMVKDPDDISYHCSKGIMSPNLDSIAFASDTGFISFAYNVPGYSNYLLRATAPLSYSPNEILVAGALDWKTFIAGANNRIIVGELDFENTNYPDSLKETKVYFNGTDGLPQFGEVSNFIYYMGYDELENQATLEKIYALSTQPNALLAFDLDSSDNELIYIGKENLTDFTPDQGVLSADKKTLILTGENEKCIKICQIHD